MAEGLLSQKIAPTLVSLLQLDESKGWAGKVSASGIIPRVTAKLAMLTDHLFN